MEKILEKESVVRVRNIISKFDSSLTIKLLNNTARTANDASDSLGCDIGAIVKSLVFKVEESFLICLVAGDKRCSLNKLKNFLNKNDVCMASANEVKENTGFSIGGVSPIGHVKKLDVLIDKSLSRFKYVFAAGGHPNCIFKITYNDLVKITGGLEKELSE